MPLLQLWEGKYDHEKGKTSKRKENLKLKQGDNHYCVAVVQFTSLYILL